MGWCNKYLDDFTMHYMFINISSSLFKYLLHHVLTAIFPYYRHFYFISDWTQLTATNFGDKSMEHITIPCKDNEISDDSFQKCLICRYRGSCHLDSRGCLTFADSTLICKFHPWNSLFGTTSMPIGDNLNTTQASGEPECVIRFKGGWGGSVIRTNKCIFFAFYQFLTYWKIYCKQLWTT